MKGLELSRAYYEAFGAPMLREAFPEYEPLIAVGLVGAGSECFGYDDECSHDHDFEPGFCLFLPGEDLIDRRAEFRLERAYAKLPKEFMGFRRLERPPAGGYRHGVIRTGDFYRAQIGCAEVPQDPLWWFTVEEQYLAEATNGEVFRDDLGQFTAVRRALLSMPGDVRLKKLAGHLWMAAQSAPYNFERCLRHGETAAAKWALYLFADHYISALFLLCRAYRPFYKWAFRALSGLPHAGKVPQKLEELLTGGDNEQARAQVARLTDGLLEALTAEGLFLHKDGAGAVPRDLADAAFMINDRIADPGVRNLNILYGV